MADTRTRRRGFRIRKFQGTEKIGIGVESFEQLKKEGAAFFGLDSSMCHIQLVDGTLVLDGNFLSTLEEQTILEFVDDRGG